MKSLTTDSNGIIETSPTRLTSASQPPETPRVDKLRAAARGEVSSVSLLAITGTPVFPSSALARPRSDGVVDNLLLATAVGSPITIEVEIPPAAEYVIKNGDALWLVKDDDDIADSIRMKILDPTVDLPGTRITAALPTLGLAQGTHTLWFAFTDPFLDNEIKSATTTFIVDTVAPGGKLGFSVPGFDALEAEIAENGITATLLAANGGVLPASIGGYQGAAFDDMLVPYVDDQPGTPVFVGEPNTLKATPVQFAYSEKQITDAGDGLKKFMYQITDRAGNVGVMSTAREFETLLAGAITTLVAPPVAAMSNNLIIEAEARTGVAVTIPAHADVIAGLWVVVVWGGIELAPAKIIQTNIAQDITVGAAQVFQQGTGSFDVTYEIYKEGTSGKLMLIGVSPATPVVVDLGVPGTVDPDPSTPWNENLQLPTVKGATGTVDNVINLADSTAPATITIPWFTTTPNEDAFISGDIITVYWNGTTPEGSPEGTPIDADITVTGQDVIKKIDFVLPILASEHQVAAGAITVAYRGSRPLGGGLFNHASTPYQTVRVESAPELPGGPGGLPLVEWTEAREMPVFPGEFALDKTRSFDGSLIRIPYYENKKLGDVIDYTYIAQEGGFVGQPDGAVIAATEIISSYTVPLGEVNTHSDILLPAHGFFKQLNATIGSSEGFQGSGKIDYSVTPVATGVPTDAKTTKTNIETRLPKD